jgi:hypothetical protein
VPPPPSPDFRAPQANERPSRRAPSSPPISPPHSSSCIPPSSIITSNERPRVPGSDPRVRPSFPAAPFDDLALASRASTIFREVDLSSDAHPPLASFPTALPRTRLSLPAMSVGNRIFVSAVRLRAAPRPSSARRPCAALLCMLIPRRLPLSLAAHLYDLTSPLTRSKVRGPCRFPCLPGEAPVDAKLRADAPSTPSSSPLTDT